MICRLEWTSSADTPSSSTSLSAPPSRATNGGGYGKPAGAEWDMGMQGREEGREARHWGRVGYSQRAGATNSQMCLSLGSKGWYTKVKGWESGGQKRCGIQDCVEENVMHQPTPRQYVFSLARVCLSHFPLCYFKHAIASHSML